MRSSSLVYLTAALAVALVLITCSASGSGTAAAEVSARAQFKLPKLFDFELFKNVFKKTYRSIVEELSRKRIFLGRAFRVFVSAVGYKYRRNSAYLAVNQRSDWTDEERKRSFMSESKVRPQASPTPMVDVEDIEETLGEISASPHGRPALEEMAKELSGRRKRDTSSPPREFSLDELIAAPELEAEPTRRVPSNNPGYQPPELSSALPAVSKPAAPISQLPTANVSGRAFLRATMANNNPAPAPTDADFSNPKADVVYVDHRQDNCLFRPRDQGDCGSCYAFASVALYEWYYCREVGEKIAFSEQYMVDCGGGAGDFDGCDGGVIDEIPNFVRKFGMELRADYPYREVQDTCPYEPDVPVSSRGYMRLHDGGFETFDPSELEQRLVQSPILMAIHVDTDTFSDYGGGVDEPLYCRAGKGRDGLHAVLFVGHGREDGQEYWLIRNSYGPAWGQQGHYKMNKKSKQCLRFYDRYMQLVDFSVPRTTRERETSPEVKKRLHEYNEKKQKKKKST